MPQAPLPRKRILALFSLLSSAVLFFGLHTSASHASTDPWSDSQLVQPATLVQELANKTNLPTIVYVGPRTLFSGSHIPGSTFHGTTSTESGLDELKKWANTIPHDTNLVIYCGCCPFEKCPNIRPAFTALHDLGFTHIRILVLATSFKSDWIDKNYPTEKGL
jgi:hypothetical protein